MGAGFLVAASFTGSVLEVAASFFEVVSFLALSLFEFESFESLASTFLASVFGAAVSSVPGAFASWLLVEVMACLVSSVLSLAGMFSSRSFFSHLYFLAIRNLGAITLNFKGTNAASVFDLWLYVNT